MTKKVFTVFCGRRRYLDILMRYVLQMLDRGIVDECHLWDYTRDMQDHKYLVSLSGLVGRGVRVVQVGHKLDFGEYYRFYAGVSDTLLIKADDDIVYIDVEAMPAFLAHRLEHPEHLLCFPTIVNNGLCAHLMQRRGDFPASCPHDFELSTGGFEALVGDGARGAWLHEWFLASVEGSSPGPREQQTKGVVASVLPPGQRVSINLFAMMAADLPLLADPGVTADDERYLTVVATQALRRNSVFAGMTVSHFAFGPQRESGLDGEVERQLLARYEALANTCSEGRVLVSCRDSSVSS